ncbi:MAG: U32 family peptidase [Eubacterium sp.]|nr:U32 family peptidase [Eubacterium sp.]
MKERKKVELLAPAGSKEQFFAAIENGADAVYMGGRFLNARQAAEGLTDGEIEQAVRYAHLRGVKVYVAMNTLVSDGELEEGADYAEFLYEAGVDAVIIQDLGLGHLIHERIPDLEMHLSTQATAVGPVAVSTAASLGYSRAVPARELSLSELRAACANGAGAEVEAFCHGALCICYSGQCQLSRYNGSRSGNRGCCAQACRLRYNTLTAEGTAVTAGVPSYPLSPKDLCLIDDLGAMIDAGVASLKIEGRLKSPEYVAVVTSIYRKYIDKYYDNGYYTVSREDREALTQIFSRGGFCKGYLNGGSGRELMSGDIPKNSGIRVGTVVKRGRNDHQVIVKLGRAIDIGDGIEIRGRETLSNIVTYIKQNEDGTTVIGDFRGEVSEGAGVYRTSSKAQIKEARKSFQSLDFESVGKRKLPLKAEMRADEEVLILRVETSDGVSAEIARELPEKLEAGGTSDRFEKALRKTGGTPFEIADVQIQKEVRDLSMKVSEINDMRRAVLSDLEAKLTAGIRRDPSPYYAEKARQDGSYVAMDENHDGRTVTFTQRELEEAARANSAGAAGDSGSQGGQSEEPMSGGNRSASGVSGSSVIAGAEERNGKEDEFWQSKDKMEGQESVPVPGKLGTIELYFLDWNDFAGFRAGSETAALLAEKNVTITAVLPLVDVIRNVQSLARVKFKPYISAVCKGREDTFLKNNFEAVQAVVEQTGCYVGNLDWITPLVKRGMKVYADYGLNIFNSETPKALAELGVTGYQYSLEHADKDSGAYPLMVLEHEPDGSMLLDPMGRKFLIKRRDFSSQVIIRPEYADEEEITRLFRAAVWKLEHTGVPSVRIYI